MDEEKVVIQEMAEESEMHRVLELALEAGRILLGNGAEIFRVKRQSGISVIIFILNRWMHLCSAMEFFLPHIRKGKKVMPE